MRLSGVRQSTVGAAMLATSSVVGVCAIALAAAGGGTVLAAATLAISDQVECTSGTSSDLLSVTNQGTAENGLAHVTVELDGGVVPPEHTQ